MALLICLLGGLGYPRASVLMEIVSVAPLRAAPTEKRKNYLHAYSYGGMCGINQQDTSRAWLSCV